MSRTLLIMAGGTGGHIMPGLAVADEMRAAGWDVVWLGARGGMEERLVPGRVARMVLIRARALRGKGLLAQLLLPANLLLSFWQSARALFRERPDVVLGMGGYVAFPGGMMASLLARPLALHEQNAIAGLANRVLAHVADKVMAAFPNALRGAEWTGNPVRAEIAAIEAPQARYAARSGPLGLLVIGGSLGARALNEALPAALACMPEDRRPRVVHQAGVQHVEAVRAGYAAQGVTGEVIAFIDDMAARYAQADVVVCRAGAMTVAELAAAGVPGVLVPFPFAVDDHQTANARFLVEQGAALLLPQAELTPQRLAALLGGLDRARLLDMAQRARALGKPDAARRVAERCVELAR
ncbi:MAG: undecaprenyldiphospho-muramoylpentapeptide beta-N-acetylglucosaminyltransferase [Burkholderiales bacterium]|nr:undecaprenyldiphospho-muramoylpentapeptide beta-N-acetylglucosaminyltransferase [Burkholderiales bacterium]